MTYELKDWMNSINFNKEDLMQDSEAHKDYVPFIINRCLSGHIDCIMFANQMNLYPHLDKDLQYYFFLNSIRKRKRFTPWLRKDKIKDLECIKRYYGYSNEKAYQALKILTKQQIEFIQSKLDTGGKND
jgi:hypothetical protein